MKRIPSLIGRGRYAEYSRAVYKWIEESLRLYSEQNVQFDGSSYVAVVETMPMFCFECGKVRIAMHPAAPANVLLACRGDFRAARRQLLTIGYRLLEQVPSRYRERMRILRRDTV